MASDVSRILKDYGNFISGGLGALGVVILLLGGDHQAGLALGIALLWVGGLSFVEYRLVSLSLPTHGELDATPGGALKENTELQSGVIKNTSTRVQDRSFAPLQLQQARLDHARLDGLDLTGASLVKISAVGADFRKATMVSANFSGADLSDANLAGGCLDDVNMSESKLDGSNFKNVTAQRLALESASLSRVKALKLSLKYSDLRQIRAERLDMSSGVIEESSFVGAQCRRVDAHLSSWTGVDLSQSVWIDCNFTQIKTRELIARGARIAGCKMEKAELVGADLREVAMIKSKMEKADLTNALLDGADLSHVDLSEASLVGASLRGVKLDGTNLSGANLTDANLQDTDLSRCIHNMLTTWPEGVNPEQLVSTLDEASLSEIVDEFAPQSTKTSEESKPRVDLSGLSKKLKARQPSREVAKTMPLDDQELLMVQEELTKSSPPPLDKAKEAEESEDSSSDE